MALRRIHRQLRLEELEPRIAPTTYHITDVNGLQAMQNDLAGTYILDNNIDASATSTWNSGAGFAPVGTTSSSFKGRFDGQGHTISGLYINRPSQNYVGLFGYGTTGISIANVGLVGDTVSGMGYVGSLAGLISGGTVSNSYATGSVIGGSSGGFAGGLVGQNNGVISNSFATASVRVGDKSGDDGGLVGANFGTISSSYATGGVTTGTVSGNDGGLVGYDSGLISDCYATGNVNGPSADYCVGGLVGYLSGGTVSNCYAAGKVSGSSVGGLVADNQSGGQVSNSYYDTQGTGQTASSGGTPETTAQMMQQITFSGWDFTKTWAIAQGLSYPMLRSNSICVDPNYGPSTPGWFVNRFAHIQDAVNAATAGAQIFVDAGNYNNDPVNPIFNDSIAFQLGATTIGSLTMSTGVVAASGCNLVISSTFSESGGSFISLPTQGSFTVGGSFNLSGGTFNRFTGAGTTGNPYLIYDVYGLQAMGLGLNASYKLTNDLDASSTTNWNGGAGFLPVGNSSSPFTGNFDGNTNHITGLYISRSSQNYVGLLGYAGTGSSISNISLTGGGVTGGSNVGGLIGYIQGGTVSNSYEAGSAPQFLCRWTRRLPFRRYRLGFIRDGGREGPFGCWRACGRGLFGDDIQFLLDRRRYSWLRRSFGGGARGLSFRRHCLHWYAAGAVSGGSSVGGLVGYTDGAPQVSGSYYDTLATGQTTSAGGTGMTTVQMMQQATFNGWDFNNTWFILEGRSYPFQVASSSVAAAYVIPISTRARRAGGWTTLPAFRRA